MKVNLLSLITAGLLFSTAAIAAENSDESPGASQYAPGQQMQQPNAKDTGPGASEYSPGHQMQEPNAQSQSTGPGASDYAPGQQSKAGNSGSSSSSSE